MLNKVRLLSLSKSLFLVGIFFLPSAPFISAILFLFCLTIIFRFKFSEIYKDKWNHPLVLAIIIMIVITLIHNVYYINIEDQIKEKIFTWSPRDSWLGLANWIPLFLIFMGFQTFLSSSEDRKVCAKYLISGSIPVLLTGFGQYFFDWHGPLYTLNNLIIWFQKPLDEAQGLSGLFSNQNYAGCWLTIIWPFSIALFFDKTISILKKSFSISLILSISFAIFLTASRSAWGGLILTLPLLIGRNIFLLMLLLIFIISTLVYLNIYIPELTSRFTEFVPEKFDIISQFSPADYANFSETRQGIMLFASKMILNNPFLGWGAGSFTYYNFAETYIYTGHPHNLFLELAFSYGITPTLFVFIVIISICLVSLKIIFFKIKGLDFVDLFFEKAWWTSFFVLFITQMIDIQYFDMRISLTFWILLAGMRSIIRENKIHPKNI